MIKTLYKYRFEIFFFSQIAILFGSLVVPSKMFETIISPILFQINLLAGILLLSKKKKLMWFVIILLIITAIVFGSDNSGTDNTSLGILEMLAYFIFCVIVTLELIAQVWQSRRVNKNVIFGLVSGYISLGLIGFFICLSIELVNPNSFQGLLSDISITENLMYYSYITLLTIGYGDILPVTPLAQKAAILIGLIGQVYLVVITAIVVGKYISQNEIEKK